MNRRDNLRAPSFQILSFAKAVHQSRSILLDTKAADLTRCTKGLQTGAKKGDTPVHLFETRIFT